MIAAICLFLLGASAGAFMAIRHFLRKSMPPWVAVGHGVAGSVGFGLLVLFCAREPTFSPARYALAILVVAVALGCVNVVYHLRRIRHRSALIVAHALFAVGGVGTLAYAVFVYPDALASSGRIETSVDALRGSPSGGERVAPLAAVAGLTSVTASAAASPTPAPAGAAPSLAALAPAASHRAGPAWADRRVAFESGSASPTPAALAALASIAGELKGAPDVRLVEVQGHADERGPDAANIALTRARASAVVNALVEQGVSPGRLRVAGYGARCPSREDCRGPNPPTSCHEEGSWQRDRRVDFVILESGVARFDGPVACDRAADLVPTEDAPYRLGSQ